MSNHNFFEIVIGLEIHITVSSERKIFNWNKNHKKTRIPNDNVGHWELGYIGSLPIINPEVIRLGLKLARALEMKIEDVLSFDRKIYNYFDLPKGYQITQQNPFAKDGFFTILCKNNEVKKIKIKSLQIEEDTGKTTYSEDNIIKIDFNRSGNPLIELVTEPVFRSTEEIIDFLKQTIFLLRYLGVSEAKMELGQFRVDLNISFCKDEYQSPRYEIKNLNSLGNIEKAINSEIEKHKKIYEEKSKPPKSSTLGFDEKTQTTKIQREKISYFFLPETNIPLISLKEEKKTLESQREKLPFNYFISTKDRNVFFSNHLALNTFCFLEEKKKIDSHKVDNWIVFFSNYLKSIADTMYFEKNFEHYLQLFFHWEKKTLESQTIKKIISKISELDNKEIEKLIKDLSLSGGIEKYDENQIKRTLQSIWEEEKKFPKTTSQIKNFLLGTVKKKHPDQPIKNLLETIEKFLLTLKF